MDSMIEFFSNNFSDCVWIAAIIIAMIPTLESKIAIPFAMNSAIWGANALNPLHAMLVGFVGSILPCFFAMFVAKKIKSKTSLVLHSRFFQKYAVKGAKIEQGSQLKKYMKLAAFVSIPLPLTGVWSGSLIAGLSNLNTQKSAISIAIGALVSAAAITLLCCAFNNSISSIFMISLLIIILFMIVDLVLSYIKPRKKSGKAS